MTPERWRQLEGLYHAALAQPAFERSAFLAKVCAGDAALRREVESLLESPATAQGFLAAPALIVGARSVNDPASSVLTGRRLGVYQLLERIGAGGMGEVYRARDTKLGRDVAIKVLPRAFTADPDRLARFEREAHLLAALNHSNIATIHGVEDSHDVRALVMELIEGPTLADRIAHGPLPLLEALTIARQIAEGLEAAHECGIIHRDLKPANIKVRPDGAVKVLDFGLGKTFIGFRPSPDPSHAPTQTAAGTREGLILGTPAYMSPEQVRGTSVDKRADVWAFGCVLYEMLTGRRAFEGQATSDVLAAVLTAEPRWNRLPSHLHPRLSLLLERCLEKNARDRYHDIADARVDIQKVAADPLGASRRAVGDGKSSSNRRLLWVAASLAATAVVAGVAAWNLRPTEPRAVVRLSYHLPDDQSFTLGDIHPLVAVAPDGSAIVYVANQRLFLRRIDELEARPIRGTEGGVTTPVFSPDGRSVVYWDRGDEELKKIDIGGGTPIVLAPATIVRGASWAPDGTILYATRDGIWSVRDGGAPKLLIPVERGLVHGPQMLPGGRSVLFTRLLARDGRSWAGAEIVVHDLESGQENVLLAGEDGRYVATGHLVYAVDTTLFAVPFDAAAGRVSGGRVPVVEGVLREVSVAGNTATANFGVTDDGTLVYVHGPTQRLPVVPRDLVMVDLKGVARPVTDERRDYWRPRISPDGSRVAVEVYDGKARHVWVVNIMTGVSTQITFTIS